MAKGSFFQDAVERVNQKPSYAQRLAAAYTEAQNRQKVDTPVLDNAKKDTQAFAPATSLEEFMGILPTPETKNDGLDGTHVADMVRSEWKKYGVDNADDYRPQADWRGRGLKSGAMGAARDSVNYIGNLAQKGRAAQAAENAVAIAMATGNTGGKTYEELYRQYIQEYTDKYKDEPLKKSVDWGEEYDRETERLAEELNVSDAAREQYQFNSALGRMAPALAVSATGNLAGGGLVLLGAGEAAKAAYTVGRVLSSAVTFTSASGAAYEDAKAHGIDDDKAITYAATVGAIELATEAISSGLGKIGGKAIGTGGLTDNLLEGFAKRVSSDAAVQNAVMYAGGVLGEGFEEWLSEWGDYFANRIMVGYDTRTGKEVWNDSLESFRQGAMMSALLNCTQLMQQGVPPQDAIRQGIDETAQEAGISPNPDMNTAQPNTAAQPNVTAQAEISPAAQTMADILRSPVNRSQANKIINNPEMRAAYEAVTGETLPGIKSEAAKAVMEYSRNNAELTPIAQVVLGQQAEQGVPQTANTPTAQDTISPAAQAMAQAAQGSEPINVGRATTIQNPYHGKTPMQEYTAPQSPITIPAEVTESGRKIYANAIAESNSSNTPLRTVLSKLYSKFEGPKGVLVNGMQFDGRPYSVDVPNSVPAKLASQGQTAEAFVLLDNISDIIANGEYVGSGTALRPDGSGKKQIIRYDYFETTVNMNGEKIVRWDVEVVPGSNNYKTHRLVNIEIDPIAGTDRPAQFGRDLPSTGSNRANSGNSDITLNENIPQADSVVNPVSQSTDAPTPATSVNTESAGAPRFPSAPTDPNAPAKVSDTITTVRDSLATPEGVKQLINDSIEDGGYHYFPITNDATAESAAARIRENGYDSVLHDWTAAVRNGQTGAELAVTGQLLYDAAVKGGDTRLALDILSDYQMLGTNTAQGLQAMRLIKNQTPEGRLYLFNKTVDNMYDSLSDKAKAKLPDGFTINEQLVNDYINAPDAKTEQAAYKAVVKDIARQLPSTLIDRWNALRYLNMLGNLRTQVRNLAGNAGMMAVAAAKNTVRYGFERLAEAVTGGKYQRNTSLVVSAEMMNAARADYDVYADFVNGDSKYSEGRTTNSMANDILANRTIFKSDHTTDHAILKPAVGALNLLGKAAEGYRKATNWAMEKGDTLFIKQQYARYLSGYLEAHGIDAQTFSQVVNGDITPSVEQQKIIDAGRNFAAKEAQEATFHDMNAFSQWVSKMGRGDKTPWYARILLEGALPFLKTPANVAVRAVEYSPAGFLDTVVKTVQAAKGKNGVTGADVINSLSKSMTGTGLFALGMMLREAGWLRGKEDDEEKEAFDKMRGMQDYSLVLPNGWSITMDWLSPAAISMFMGVAFYDAIQDDGFQVSDFVDVLTQITDPMIEMSMLQGINDTLDNIKYSDNNLIQLALSTTMSYLTQGLTNTLLGQAERTFEDRRYSTFINGDNRTENVIQRNIGKASAKIPGWDYHQVEYVDAWGRTEYTGNAFARAFENFLSPGYLSKQNSTEVDNELQRLYDAGERNVLPKRIGMSDTVGVYNEKGVKVEDRNLTQDEYVQFQKIMGSTALEMVKDLMNTPGYDEMSDAAKAKAISEIYSYAKNKATMTIEPSSKSALQTDVSKLSNPSAYYGTMASYSTAAKDSENRNYTELDSLVDTFGSLPKDVQNAVTDKEAEIGKLVDAKENGYTSRQYYNVYDSVKSLTPADGYENVATWQKITDICSMNIPDQQKDYFTGNYFQGQTHDKYLEAREKGYTPYSIALAYRTKQLANGTDANGDGKIDRGSTKAAFIKAMMSYGASQQSAEYFWKLFE